MAQITAGMVKELRERTGIGMMDCKKALVEVAGDMDKAIDHLRKVSGLKAAKKALRIAAQGVVVARVADDRSRGVLVEVNCETDFVAKDESFLAFTEQCIDAALAEPDLDAAGLLASGIEAEREKLVQKIGENINLRRVVHVYARHDPRDDSTMASIFFGYGNPGCCVGGYVHGNRKIASLVALSGGDGDLARRVAMHVAAMNPLVVRGEDLPEEVLAKESAIHAAQARESGKPEAIVEKMIAGRMRKFVAEVSLLQQAFVQNPDISVGELLRGADASVLRMVRFEAGEGIEQKKEDFAAEVAAQVEAS